jgi:hypothetical protein
MTLASGIGNWGWLKFGVRGHFRAFKSGDTPPQAENKNREPIPPGRGNDSR